MKEQRYEVNFQDVMSTRIDPRDVNPCPRCRVATLRWITSSWRCASCGYHEGCCG